MENWHIAALVRVAAVAVVIYYSRKVMARTDRTLSLLLQFALAASWTSIVALHLGQLDFSRSMMLSIGVGCLNGLAVYCMWHANAISTAKNAFFTAFDDIFAMLLTGIVVTGAVAFLTLGVSLGMILCVGAAFALAYNNWRKQKKGESGTIPGRFYLYASAYAALWGFAMFATGYLALKEIGVWRFASGWYVGATIVGIIIILLDRSGRIPRPTLHPAAFSVTLRESACIAIAVSVSLVYQYIALVDRSLVIVQPIFLIIDIIIPAIIGVWKFGEAKQIDWRDGWLYGVGFLGVAIIFGTAG